MWTIFEASIDDFCVAFLLHEGRWKTLKSLTDIKGPLLEFAAGGDEERAAYLLDAVKRQVKAPLKIGVGRFEEVLDLFGLGGPVHEDVRRVLLEFVETRNVLLHRRGVADRAFVERCPWLGFKVGDTVNVSRSRHRAFVFSMSAYHWELGARLAQHEVFSEGDVTIAEAREASDDMRRAMNSYLERAARAEADPPEIE